ncbi:DoxX family protein [Mucilaginibacter paludis]|uniref:DoxX family protein n=1 Tax=Mucilaginibacter paludis DSM 18603 TaxID=714943 RepID=H1YF27_9SPHI|nr:MauE/DoxX family redox-associated membrane protein [Mucilaginibacter paludis]EHQ25280.1 DoxX family protein [Mucilaginibacter paludis DSM 18603]
MQIIKNIGLVLLIAGYIFAGINHFRHPGGYLKIMPPYLPYPQALNFLAGFFEVAFALLMIFPQTRHLAAWGIILMLMAFMPVHIYMIQNAPMKMGNLVVGPLMAWARVPLQALLIAWAWWYTK